MYLASAGIPLGKRTGSATRLPLASRPVWVVSDADPGFGRAQQSSMLTYW